MNRKFKSLGKSSVSFALSLIMLASSLSYSMLCADAYDVESADKAAQVQAVETTNSVIENTVEDTEKEIAAAQEAAKIKDETTDDNGITEESDSAPLEAQAETYNAENTVPEVSKAGPEEIYYDIRVVARFEGNDTEIANVAYFTDYKNTTPTHIENATPREPYKITAVSSFVRDGNTYFFSNWSVEDASGTLTIPNTNLNSSFSPYTNGTVVANYVKGVTVTVEAETGSNPLNAKINGKNSDLVAPGKSVTITYDRDNNEGITELSINGRTDIDPVLAPWSTKFEYTVPDDISSDFVLLYKVGSTGTIEVDFKYYDRGIDTSSTENQPLSVNVYPTTLICYPEITGSNYTAAVASAVTSSDSTQEGTNVKTSPNSITNAIDEYYFWPTQEAAVAGIKSMTNYHSRGSTDTYSSLGLTDTQYGYHADCYGYLKGESSYMADYRTYCRNNNITYKDEDEKWVTYYDSNDREITNPDSSTTVTKVVVWGFNTPKDYKISYTVFEEDTKEVYYDVNLNVYVNVIASNFGYVANEKTTSFDHFKYQEHIGGSNATADSFSDYYKKVYDLEGVNSNDANLQYGLLPGNDASDLNITTDVKHVTEDEEDDYYFTGWYVPTESGGYTKLTADETYTGFVTSALDLYAGYTDIVDNDRGMSLVSNGIERYSDGTNDYVRYNVTANAYGYEDNTDQILRMSVIYFFLTGYDKTTGSYTHLEGFESTDINEWMRKTKSAMIDGNDGVENYTKTMPYVDVVMNALSDDTNILSGKTLEYSEATLSWYDKATGLKIIADNPVPVAIYTYAVNRSDDETLKANIDLSKKNITNFTTVLNYDDVSDVNDPFADIIVMTAIYDKEGFEREETGSPNYHIILSDNYVRFNSAYN